MLECSEMFIMMWLAPAACPAVQNIIASHRSNRSSLAINLGLAPSLPHNPKETSEVRITRTHLIDYQNA